MLLPFAFAERSLHTSCSTQYVRSACKRLLPVVPYSVLLAPTTTTIESSKELLELVHIFLDGSIFASSSSYFFAFFIDDVSAAAAIDDDAIDAMDDAA